MDSWGTQDSDLGAERSEVGRVELDPLAGPDGGEESRRLARHWLDEIKQFDLEHKRWRKRCRSIEERYQDQRALSDEEGTKKANYLWSNTQTLLPAIYGKCPTPIAERRFKDPDPIGRTAATIIEKTLRNDLEGTGYHDAISDAVFDYLLPGRGVTWVRFEPEFGPSVSLPTYSANPLRDEQGQIEAEDDTQEEEKLEDTEQVLMRESAPVDYVHWDDWGYLPRKARRWSEVRVVFKRVYPSRDEMVDRWGRKIGKRIPLQRSEKERRDNSGASRSTKDDRDEKGEVFELWDKDTLSVFWVASGYDWLVNRADDPLELAGFFPCPRPIMMRSTNSTMIPTPLFLQYADQAKQIDELTQRISQLAKSIKIVGVYDAACDEFMRLLDESVENELLPSDTWRRFMDKVKESNGMGPVWFMPIKQQIEALQVLVEQKERIVAEMDRITGLTDIIRGVTADGRETLGGKRLANNNGKSRLREYQDEVQRFARDTLRIKAEVICKHFRAKTLVDMSGALYDEGFGFSDIEDFLASGMLGDPSALSQLPSPASAPAMPQQGPALTGPMAGPPMPGVGGPPAMPQGPGGMIQQQQASGPSKFEKLIAAVLRIHKAIKLLRDDIERGFRIDIETDSTIAGDEAQERQDATQFISEVTNYLKMSHELAAADPDCAPLLGKLLQFGVRRFRVGRDLEQAIDEYVEKAEAKAKKAALMPPPPNPEMIKAQAKVKEMQLQGQLDQQKSQQELQADQVKAAAEERSRQIELHIEQIRAANEAQQSKLDMLIAMMQAKADMHATMLDQHAKQMDHQRGQEAAHLEHQRHMWDVTHPQPTAAVQ